MARVAWGATVSGTRNGSPRVTALGGVTDPVNGATVAADATTVDTDIGVLVADGVSPTQAHVTTAAADWAVLLAELAGSPELADVVLSINLAHVTTRNQLREAVRQLLQVIEGSDALTP